MSTPMAWAAFYVVQGAQGPTNAAVQDVEGKPEHHGQNKDNTAKNRQIATHFMPKQVQMRNPAQNPKARR